MMDESTTAETGSTGERGKYRMTTVCHEHTDSDGGVEL